ncbi:MAG: YfhO family protein [Anaerolineaceae bacterium]|nr:YfhO family protein [Anaerolineaceae bacterium]
MTTRKRLTSPDAWALLFLLALWLLFFWRLFTPVTGDQTSLKQGDFSGQFVAFGGYQYQRFAAGEVPLWDPYNNGGLPFIADTQAAVFYPPRLATIALANLSGGWSYHALELEMTLHVLAYSIMLYALLRRLTLGRAGSIYAGLVAAVVGAYGGFLSGYPPLQLALLEASIWLPLAVIGLVEASREAVFRWRWLVLTGFALGLSWMAGHPQTSWFLTYLLVAYFAYRVYTMRYGWRVFMGGTALFGVIAGGMAAVQLLPGVEYLAHTARVNFTYDAKGNGFPFQDVIQFIFPGVVSLFSPLYMGIVGLALAIIALWRRLPGTLFWGITALLALGLSFGANSALFPALYNLLPGMRFFRGQERAAFLVANSLAILAGLGAAHLAEWDWLKDFKATRRIQTGLLILLILCGIVAALVFVGWLGDSETYGDYLNPVVFSALITALTLFALPYLLAQPHSRLRWALLLALLVFELFTVNMDAPSDYDSVPPGEQLSLTPPPAVAQGLADTDTPFRVDGFRALHDNYGSLYGVMDMRGISPLFLNGPFTIINAGLINPTAWELFAVRYVYTDWVEMPVPSEIVGVGTDRYGTFNIHQLTDSRPFAHLVYDVATVTNDEAAYALLGQPDFLPRRTVILNQSIDLPLDNGNYGQGTAVVTAFAPEQFTIQVSTPGNAVLSIAHSDYPGWEATLDGQPTAILRAYGALAAVIVPEGEHTVTFVYNPLSYRIGAIASLITWGGLAIFALSAGVTMRRRHASST